MPVDFYQVSRVKFLLIEHFKASVDRILRLINEIRHKTYPLLPQSGFGRLRLLWELCFYLNYASHTVEVRTFRIYVIWSDSCCVVCFGLERFITYFYASFTAPHETIIKLRKYEISIYIRNCTLCALRRNRDFQRKTWLLRKQKSKS